jgi:hypothetical protein
MQKSLLVSKPAGSFVWGGVPAGAGEVIIAWGRMFQNETFVYNGGMSEWFAVAVSQRRRAEWERAFGSGRVPVMQGRARWVEFRDGPGWGFDVAVGRLHYGQVCRLAAHVARVNRVGYVTALRLVGEGLTIRADGLVIETADAEEYRPFVFGRSYGAAG